MQAIIAGATGLVGAQCWKIARNRYESVTALVRRPSGIAGERVIDFERLNELGIPAGAHVFCALGTTIKKAGSQEAFRRVDFDYPRMLAERTAAAGGRFMLVSSVGADARSNNFYLRVKGELEDSIRGLALDAFHVFRPSFLVGERAEKRAGERLGIAVARTIGFLLPSKYRAIEARVVARAMVASAERAGYCVYQYREMKELAS